MLRLSVLDQSPIRSGGTAAQAVAESVALARAADRLGYHRYWLAEHHNTAAFAGAAPEILIGHIAAQTQRIRVGSGGVMLMHYAPLKVAEQFRMLETLYPGRIDLGLGRAPGADPRTMAALQSGPQTYGIEAYPQLVALVQAFLADAAGHEVFPPGHPYRGLHAMPRGPGMPEIWLLGSGLQSAIYAAEMGLGFSFAHFIAQGESGPVAQTYRERFRPSAAFPHPRLSIGVFVLVADTVEEAERQAATRNLWVLRLLKGQHTPFPAPEEALAHAYGEDDRALLRAIAARGITGTPAQVRGRLLALADQTGAEEIVALTITHDPGVRLRSYELLAEAFALCR